MKKSNISLQTKDGSPFKIPIKGSLGILALGHVGIHLWRTKRMEHKDLDEEQNKKGFAFEKTFKNGNK